MDLELTQQLKTIIDKLAYTDESSKSGWNFSLIDYNIIRFQPFGYLNVASFERMSKSFDILEVEYFKNAEFLIFLFDFTNFKKAAPEVRLQIVEGRVFENDKISIAFYGMNYFVSAIFKIISNRLASNRLFMVKDEKAALEMAKQLISNYQIQKVKDLQPKNYYLLPEKTIEVYDKLFQIRSRHAWTFNDPGSDYSYKIDLIDENILVSRPSGYIRYQNSVMANVLFDKVVNSELGNNNKYYRIQDYSSVNGAENKARRDFTDYIINGIDKIDLMVFYGLNTRMKTVVRLGILMHPTFVKVRIANTFEEALELIIADKYKISNTSKQSNLNRQKASKHKAEQEEILALNRQKNSQQKENERIANILFDKISKITFGAPNDNVSFKINENHLFYDVFNAVQLLHEDFTELRNDRDIIRLKLEKILSEHFKEIQNVKIDYASKLKLKEDFIRSSGHELDLSLEAILNAIQLLHHEENQEAQKSLFEIIKMAGFNLQDGIMQFKSNLVEKHQSLETISESMFNYRKNIVQLIEVARMRFQSGTIVFENEVEENLPSFLIGDKRKFNQLVNIYLENAIKFTYDGFIKVKTQVLSKTSNRTRIKIIVEDSGIGIDEFKKANIFKEEDFENDNPEKLNKGFGLLIAKNLARVLDAKVGFESEKGVGSKFWIELNFSIGYHDKVSQMNAARNQRKPLEKKDLTFDGNNALLIMNDTIKQNLLVQMLRKKGILSRIKLNYESLNDIKGIFDFVFIGLQLIGGKELNSFSLIKNKIKSNPDSKNPIYIALVDTLIDPIIEEYRKAGVDYFINNSFKISDIDQLFKELK